MRYVYADELTLHIVHGSVDSILEHDVPDCSLGIEIDIRFV